MISLYGSPGYAPIIDAPSAVGNLVNFTAIQRNHIDLPIFNAPEAAPMWDGYVPANTPIYTAEKDPAVHNVAAYRVACRLYDLGFWEGNPPTLGQQGYPVHGVAAWQAHHGWDVEPPGKWGPKAGGLLFG